MIDLGFGASPTTTVELRSRLAGLLAPGSRVVGLEIDPDRVEHARARLAGPAADLVEFRLGGFELAGLGSAEVIRAANVLRQYPQGEVPRYWQLLAAGLGPGGVVVEGTCDEVGRLAAWVTIPADRHGVPESLTLAADLAHLARPSAIAARLPKALIHRNVPGEPVNRLLADLDAAWDRAAPLAAFGARQRWIGAVGALRASGWPVADSARRWRLGEVTVAWDAVC